MTGSKLTLTATDRCLCFVDVYVCRVEVFLNMYMLCNSKTDSISRSAGGSTLAASSIVDQPSVPRF